MGVDVAQLVDEPVAVPGEDRHGQPVGPGLGECGAYVDQDRDADAEFQGAGLVGGGHAGGDLVDPADLDVPVLGEDPDGAVLDVVWHGLRRGEVLGLRWDDVDLDKGTITITETRVIVDCKVVVGEPKSRNGKRRLPMDDELIKALKALKTRQATEKLAAGEGYADSGRVVVDEGGMLVWPEWYSDEFGRVTRRAGLRRITLHDLWHTTLTLMEHAGVPISIIARWAGHYDPSFTCSKYVHADDNDLATGTEALGGIYN